MSVYTATVQWQLGAADDAARAAFGRQHYSRVHHLCFDGGVSVPGSAAPSVVRAPWSDPSAVDPEELFVASLASCHMLWFLSLAADAGYVVLAYDDEALGTMARNDRGQLAMTEIVLRPLARFAAPAPDAAALAALHHRAHEACFIANSVRSGVRIEPRAAPGHGA